MRRPWTASEVATLTRLYADTPTRDIAAQLGHPLSATFLKAIHLGLRKSPSYMASPAACRLRCGDNIGKPHRFPKGHVPANKGLRRPGYAPGRMAQTQFRPGVKPHTWKPIGSERLCDGYLQRKVTDTGYPPRDWQPVHRLLWEEAYGALPPGYTVSFIDGDRTHVTLDNLCLMSRQDLAKRNSMWTNYPPELARTIQLVGALKRKINNRRTNDEKQD